VGQMTFTSPFAASFALPLTFGAVGSQIPLPANWPVFWGLVAFYLLLNLLSWIYSLLSRFPVCQYRTRQRTSNSHSMLPSRAMFTAA
jgi:hypothetical protein